MTDTQKTIIQAKKLLHTYKTKYGTITKTLPTSSPLIFLLRRNLTIEFHKPQKQRKAKTLSSKFTYTHSNGEEYTVDLSDSYMHTGKDDIENLKVFIHHEDWAFPVPPQPLIELLQLLQTITLDLETI